eukprot:472947_1
MSWLGLGMGLLLASGCTGWVTTPSFNERRVEVQLRKVVKFRRGPGQNWCQVSLNEESEVMEEYTTTGVRKTEVIMPLPLSKFSKMGKNALVSAGLLWAAFVTRTDHVLAQEGCSTLPYSVDVHEELGASPVSEESWGGSNALQRQPVITEKCDDDISGGGGTADFDFEAVAEEAGVAVDDYSVDETAKAMSALVDETVLQQASRRRPFSRISLKPYGRVGPISGCAAVLVSGGIGAYIMTKRRQQKNIKAMPTAAMYPTTISTPKHRERGGGADLDLELLDADPVPLQYSPAAPNISNLDFFPGEPLVGNTVPENEPDTSGGGHGSEGLMSKKTSSSTPIVSLSPQKSEPKKKNLGFGSLFKRDNDKRPVSLRDALSMREENKPLQTFLFAVALELSAVVSDDGVFGIPLTSSSNQGISTIKELKEASGRTVRETAEELANIVNAMVVALVDSSVERLKEKNEDQVFAAMETLLKFMDKAGNLFEVLCPDTSIDPPIRYNGGARKGKLEDLYRCYASRAMKGLSVPPGLDRLQDLFMIKGSKVNSITQKLLMFNMMKMMSDGRNGEDGAGSLELSGLMEAMGGTGGALPHGKDPFEGLQNLDPKLIKDQVNEFRQIVQRGAVSKEDVINLRKSYKEMGLNIDEMLLLAKINQSGMSSELKELFSLLETVLSKYPNLR